MRFVTRTAAVLVASLSFAACAGLGPQGPTPTPDAPGEVPAGAPTYETFDPAGYDAEPEAAAEDVAHDVPPRVMAGRVVVPGTAAPAPSTEPTAQEVEGYRIQIFSSPNREAAERVRAEALAWWGNARTSPNAPPSLDATIVYLQPYYRVRVGSFETREAVDRSLGLVRQRFPEAFVVPDRVTVLR